MNYIPINHRSNHLTRLGWRLSLLIILFHTLILGAAAGIRESAGARPVPASTIVSGNITTNTTWTKAG